MESEGKDLLMRRLDECLREHAKALGAGDELPEIQAIYELQEMSEVHYYLKAEHPYTPQEVNALLKFEDPLAVACACWEENPDRYAFDIRAIMEEHHMDEMYPLADPSTVREEKPSLREQLRAAQKELIRQQKPDQPVKGNRGGDAI